MTINTTTVLGLWWWWLKIGSDHQIVGVVVECWSGILPSEGAHWPKNLQKCTAKKSENDLTLFLQIYQYKLFKDDQLKSDRFSYSTFLINFSPFWRERRWYWWRLAVEWWHPFSSWLLCGIFSELNRPDAKFFLTSGLSWVEEGQESVSRNLLQYNYRCGSWGLQNHFFINMYLACWNLNTFGVKLLPFSFFR